MLDSYPKYIKPAVKLEIGSLDNQVPTEWKEISLMMNEQEVVIGDASCSVNVLAAERTFWEKATILHKAINRATAGKNLPTRYSRHFYDFYMLWGTYGFKGESTVPS